MQMMSACGPSRTSSNVRFCAAVVDERTYRYCAEPDSTPTTRFASPRSDPPRIDNLRTVPQPRRRGTPI